MPNIFDASYLGYGPVQGLKKVTLHQKFGKHSLAILDYEIRAKAQYIMPSERNPAKIRWGAAPVGVRTFYGYVNHYDTQAIRGKQETTEVYVLGTSSTLNSTNPTNWNGVTRSGIAREIAKRNKLRSVIHTHPYVLESWATGNRTDFQSLLALAEETGYRAWVDGSTLYFLDPKKVLASAQTDFVPYFDKQKIRHSSVTGGTNAPREDKESVRRRVLYGLDNGTNEFFTTTSGDPKYPTAVINAPANTYEDARDTVNATDNRETDYYTLEATLEGSADVYPGTLINLAAGTNSTDRAGVWLVSEARHEITREDFVTHVVASRGANLLPSVTMKTSVRNVRERLAAVIRDGKHWEAELQEHVNV